MNEPIGFFFWGSVNLLVGALIRLNLEAIVQFDQNTGLRLKSWFNKKLGKSPLNRDLWSVGTPSGFSTIQESSFALLASFSLFWVAHWLVLHRRTTFLNDGRLRRTLEWL